MVKFYLLLVPLLTMSAVCDAHSDPTGGTETTRDLNSVVQNDRYSKRELRGPADSTKLAQEERMAPREGGEVGTSAARFVEEAAEETKSVWSKVKSKGKALVEEWKEETRAAEAASKAKHRANLENNAVTLAKDENGNYVVIPHPPQPHLD